MLGMEKHSDAELIKWAEDPDNPQKAHIDGGYRNEAIRILQQRGYTERQITNARMSRNIND